MKIAIITDGNNTLGMGHVYQSLTLAERLSKRLANQATIRFLTKSHDTVVDLLGKTGHVVSRHDRDDSIFDSLRKQDFDRIIIDKLDVDPDFARQISEKLKAKLIILTNLTDANKHARLTVMAGMGSDFKNLRVETPNGQVQLWGPKYWLIRPEFFNRKLKTTQTINKVMLMFGGADPANLSSSVLEAILDMNAGIHLTVVLGPAFSHRKDLDAVLGRNACAVGLVEVLTNLEQVAERMSDNDLIFVSPGLSFFEALLVGTPVVCFHQNDFQRKAWAGHIQTYDKSDVFLVNHLIEHRQFIFPTSPAIEAMEVGSGINEMITEILC